MDLSLLAARALVVKPGDRMLLVFDRSLSMQQVDEVEAALRERFPDVTFAFVDNVREVVVEATCQQHPPEALWPPADHHHECERERGHPSLVHRCTCGVQWWPAHDDEADTTRDGA